MNVKYAHSYYSSINTSLLKTNYKIDGNDCDPDSWYLDVGLKLDRPV